MFQGIIQGLVGSRLADFDEGNFQDLRAQVAQSGREGAGLVTGASDQHSYTR
jgi:hypothetical protein